MTGYLKSLIEEVRSVNQRNGWFDVSRTFGDDIALLHSELSEALEAYREDLTLTTLSETGKPEGVPSELADVFIRLLDLCGRMNIDLENEYATKMFYNRTRGYRHGMKLL